jgi:hypothetical protein
MKALVCLILCAGMLSGCSHEVSLAYTCDPSGAMIYQEDLGQVGPCPVTLKYNSQDIAIKDGLVYTKKLLVVWNSGVSLLVPPRAVEINADGTARMVFTRPPEMSDYDKDQRYSVRFESDLHTPGEKLVTSPHQDRDIFATLDRSVTCAFDSLSGSIYAHCP